MAVWRFLKFCSPIWGACRRLRRAEPHTAPIRSGLMPCLPSRRSLNLAFDLDVRLIHAPADPEGAVAAVEHLCELWTVLQGPSAGPWSGPSTPHDPASALRHGGSSRDKQPITRHT